MWQEYGFYGLGQPASDYVFGSGGNSNGTSDQEIERSLRAIPNFLGVFSADNLPEDINKTDACLIVNYSDENDTSGGTHWVALLHLNNRETQPAFFDSYGYRPDDQNSVLHADADFEKYIVRKSKESGHNGKYKYNLVNMQSQNGDECGEFAAYACKVNCLPYTDASCMNPRWRNILKMNQVPGNAQRVVKKLMHMR